MAKKSFKDNPAMQFISTHDVQDTQEVQHKQDEKRKKLSRINMAFTDENLEFMQLISRIDGTSITEHVNRLISKEREERAGEIEKASQILKGVK